MRKGRSSGVIVYTVMKRSIMTEFRAHFNELGMWPYDLPYLVENLDRVPCSNKLLYYMLMLPWTWIIHMKQYTKKKNVLLVWCKGLWSLLSFKVPEHLLIKRPKLWVWIWPFFHFLIKIAKLLRKNHGLVGHFSF